MPYDIFGINGVYPYPISVPRITLILSLSVRKRYSYNGYPVEILNHFYSNLFIRYIPWRRTRDID